MLFAKSHFEVKGQKNGVKNWSNFDQTWPNFDQTWPNFDQIFSDLKWFNKGANMHGK